MLTATYQTGRYRIRGGARRGEGCLADPTAAVGPGAIASSAIVGIEFSTADDPAVGAKPLVHLAEIETGASGTELEMGEPALESVVDRAAGDAHPTGQSHHVDFAPMNLICEKAGLSERAIYDHTGAVMEYFGFPFNVPPPE